MSTGQNTALGVKRLVTKVNLMLLTFSLCCNNELDCFDFLINDVPLSTIYHSLKRFLFGGFAPPLQSFVVFNTLDTKV